MMHPVKFKRVLQFRAGPNETTFHACALHQDRLARGDVDLFFPTADQPMEPEDDDEDEPTYECWFCRGENGP